jgi:hypothetical protein
MTKTTTSSSNTNSQAEQLARAAGLERGRQFDGKQHIYGEDQIRLGWGLYRAGRADDARIAREKRAYYAGFRSAAAEHAQPAAGITALGDPTRASMNVILDDGPAADQREQLARERARQLPPPRENPPDSLVHSFETHIREWGGYWAVQAMLRALRLWSDAGPNTNTLDIAEFQRVSALRKVAGL